MQKPTSVVVREFKDEMVNQINQSCLPFFVIEPILREITEAVHNEAERVYQLEKAQYEAALNEKDTEMKEMHEEG